jgi:hypothetical protein
MKILSYKILSETKGVLGVGGFNSSTRRGTGLAGAIKTAQQYGLNSSEATDFYFKETVDMHFTIYNTQSQQALGTYHTLFLQRVEENGLKLYLHPYDKYKRTALAPNNAKKWGSLILYDGNGNAVNLNNLNDLKFDEINPNTYYFLFNIGNSDYFKKINNLYKYTDLNRLLSFNNTTGTYNNDYYIKFLSVVEGKVPSYYGIEKMSLNNQFDIQIQFLTNGQLVNVPLFGNSQAVQRYTLTVNPQSPTGVNPPQGFGNVISLTNLRGETAYIYTQQTITNANPTTARQCYLYIPQGTMNGTYDFNIIRMKRA